MSKLKFIFLFLLVSFSASSILNAHSTEASTQAEYAKESITNETNQQSDKKEITGNITDEYGEPLIGAKTFIKILCNAFELHSIFINVKFKFHV